MLIYFQIFAFILSIASGQKVNSPYIQDPSIEAMARKLDLLESKVEKQATLINTLTIAFADEREILLDAHEKIEQLLNSENKNFDDTIMTRRAADESKTPFLIERPPSKQTHFKTCYEFYLSYKEIGKGDGEVRSGMYWIDFDGIGVGEPPVYVYCNMTDGTTSIGHNIVDDPVTIDKCSGAGCYSHDVTYNVSPKQLELLIQLSESCAQHIRFDCYGVPFQTENGEPNAWWTDRQGSNQYFWSGKATKKHTCECGSQKPSSCVDPNFKCNCDSLSSEALFDEGFITEKDLLPVIKLQFGRTALPRSQPHSQFTLGSFRCNGRNPSMKKIPTSCADLKELGHQNNGFYQVQGTENKIQSIYCDFTHLPSSSLGSEKFIGYIDVKSSPVYFSVQRKSSFKNIGSTIQPYQIERLNVGSSMNLQTGIFTAPTEGRYFFSFSGNSGPDTYLSLYLNEKSVTTSYGKEIHDTLSLVTTLELKRGDTISLRLGSTGYLYENEASMYSSFTGILLEELN